MSQLRENLSIAKGRPLSEEPGLGALTLPGFLREVTTRFADREALVLHTPAGATRWTYTELWERAVEVARALAALGVGKGDRVGVLMTNRPEWVASFFGIGLAGGVAVTLSTFSTKPELEYLLDSSGVSVVLFERHVAKKDFTELLCDLEPAIRTAKPGELRSTKFPFLRRLAVIDDPSPAGAIERWSAFTARAKETPPAIIDARAATVAPADAAAIFYSSGSTARPKGIVNAHRAIAIQCWRFHRIYALGENVRTWTANAFFWSGNFGMALGPTLVAGGVLALQQVFDPEEALELMEKERVTIAHAWPHQWAQLEAAANWKTVDLSSMKYVDPTRPAANHPTVKRDEWVEPWQSYGNTETFTISAALPGGKPPPPGQKSSGEPLTGNTLKIVDQLTGTVVPRGVQGEIAVKGATLMLGYLGIPLDETLDDEGFFRTGDGGYIDEKGLLYFQGRLTEIIKTGGANVSPVEVDDVLAGCAGVKVCKTVGIPHETLGEMVVTCVVRDEGSSIDEAQIRDFLKPKLASYKIPRRVLFFREDELAFTGSAKVKGSIARESAQKRLQAEAAA